MGVWIETRTMSTWVAVFLLSHPVWVCGLKQLNNHHHRQNHQSHPVWVCGLKLACSMPAFPSMVSHPVWVCGLKLQGQWPVQSTRGVTPCMGVWIETAETDFADIPQLSHPVWVCGLKLHCLAIIRCSR